MRGLGALRYDGGLAMGNFGLCTTRQAWTVDLYSWENRFEEDIRLIFMNVWYLSD